MRSCRMEHKMVKTTKRDHWSVQKVFSGTITAPEKNELKTIIVGNLKKKQKQQLMEFF